jgi:TatA/E family protein of Tat protein translocase
MLSIPHLIIIFVVALVVFGPEKLPELARNLGKVMAEFRRATGDLRSTFEGHMRDLEREADTKRIGGPPVSPTGSASAPSVGEPAAPGTVPSLPAHLGPAIEGPTITADPSVETPPPQTGAETPAEPTDTTETKTEMSDGGSRPA